MLQINEAGYMLYMNDGRSVVAAPLHPGIAVLVPALSIPGLATQRRTPYLG